MTTGLYPHLYYGSSYNNWRKYVPIFLFVGFTFMVGVQAGYLGPLSLSFSGASIGKRTDKDESELNYAGISNLSNTCYMNSVIQGLYSSEKFRTSILSSQFKKGSVGQELQSIFKKLFEANKAAAIKPYGLVSVMNVDMDEQQDAEEFLLALLNGVDDSMEANSAVHSNKEKSVLPTDHFRFTCRQRIRCVDFEHNNDKAVRSLDLSVDFQNSLTLHESIENYFQPELLSGDSKYKCAVHGLQEAEKSLSFVDFPGTLIVHLKRFAFDQKTFEMTKISSPLQLPLELHLAPFTTLPDPTPAPADNNDDNNSPSTPNTPNNTPISTAASSTSSTANSSYRLSALIIHEGDIQSGHYVAVVKKPEGWVVFDDRDVYKTEEEAVLSVAAGIDLPPMKHKLPFLNKRGASATAYLLFYSKIEEEEGEKKEIGKELCLE